MSLDALSGKLNVVRDRIRMRHYERANCCLHCGVLPEKRCTDFFGEGDFMVLLIIFQWWLHSDGQFRGVAANDSNHRGESCRQMQEPCGA